MASTEQFTDYERSTSTLDSRNKDSPNACDKCKIGKTKCDGDYFTQKPCSYCLIHQEECTFSEPSRRGSKIDFNDPLDLIERLDLIEDQLKKLTEEFKNTKKLASLNAVEKLLLSITMHSSVTEEQTNLLKNLYHFIMNNNSLLTEEWFDNLAKLLSLLEYTRDLSLSQPIQNVININLEIWNKIRKFVESNDEKELGFVPSSTNIQVESPSTTNLLLDHSEFYPLTISASTTPPFESNIIETFDNGSKTEVMPFPSPLMLENTTSELQSKSPEQKFPEGVPASKRSDSKRKSEKPPSKDNKRPKRPRENNQHGTIVIYPVKEGSHTTLIWDSQSKFDPGTQIQSPHRPLNNYSYTFYDNAAAAPPRQDFSYYPPQPSQRINPGHPIPLIPNIQFEYQNTPPVPHVPSIPPVSEFSNFAPSENAPNAADASEETIDPHAFLDQFT